VVAASRSISRQHRAALFAGAVLAGLQPGAAIGPALCAGANGAGGVTISDTWVQAVEKPGADLSMSMTIRNDAEVADALLRVRCSVANFAVKHAIDRGEGAPAMREIASIPIAASSITILKPDAYHVMLVQTRQALAAGETFHCSVVFQKAGTIETEVKVHGLP